MQNYKYLKCKNFSILLKNVSNRLSMIVLVVNTVVAWANFQPQAQNNKKKEKHHKKYFLYFYKKGLL